jgi:hypothetical protein
VDRAVVLNKKLKDIDIILVAGHLLINKLKKLWSSYFGAL